jgi:hypothetical protein
MHSNEKKELTSPEGRENNIFQQLKDVAREKQFGSLKCEILVHQGHIVEVKHQPFVSVIR